MVVKKNIVDLTSNYDVSEYNIKSQRHIGNGILRKLRLNKSKVYVQVKNCVLMDTLVSKNNDVALMLQPVAPLMAYIIALEKLCIKRVTDKRMEWLDDANVTVDDSVTECIKYHHDYGKVICLRMKPDEKFDLSGAKAGDMINCVLSVEGLYFRQSRFGLMWSIDHVEIAQGFKWDIDTLQTADEYDGDDIAAPDTVDIDDMRREIKEALDAKLNKYQDKYEDYAVRIGHLTNLVERINMCDDDTSEIEHIRNELEAL